MSTDGELGRIKKKLEKANSEYNKLKGKKETLMEQLNELGYTTIKSAEQALETLEDELSTLEKTFNKDLKAFKNKYSELLGE